MIGEQFYFNNQSSDDLGIYLVKLDTGYIRHPFLSDKEIISEQIPGNDIPYVYDVRRKPLKVTLTLSCIEGVWTTEKRRQIARWLDNDEYSLFYSVDDPNKWYYLQYVGGIDLNTNGNLQGYIEVEFENISPYTYSPVYNKAFDFSTITSPTQFEFINYGDNDLFLELEILKNGDGDISIINTSDEGREFKFVNLANQETVYVDNKKRDIISDLGVYRYDNFNGNYLRLKRGVNSLQINGSCILNLRYQFEIKG